MERRTKLTSSASLQERMMQCNNELYRLGAIYEKKGKFGKFLMRLVNRGDRGQDLESGRVVYSRHHYRESAIEAYNNELIASWSDK